MRIVQPVVKTVNRVFANASRKVFLTFICDQFYENLLQKIKKEKLSVLKLKFFLIDKNVILTQYQNVAHSDRTEVNFGIKSVKLLKFLKFFERGKKAQNFYGAKL